MPRKSPVRHGVKDHQRKRSNVNRYTRGSGSMSVTEIKARKGTIDEHKRKLKKIGDSISYLDNERRVTGVVVGIRAEYYLVERNGKVWKVDRHSVFTRIGGALKGAGAKALTAGKAGLGAAVAGAKRGASGFKASVGETIERRAEERANWKEWKKEMEAEERKILEKEKAKIRRKDETRKFKEKIRKGPLWKRATKSIGREVLDKTSVSKSLGLKKKKAPIKERKVKARPKKKKSVTKKKETGRRWIFAVHKFETGSGKNEVTIGKGDKFKTKTFKEWESAEAFAHKKAKELKLKSYQVDTPSRPHKIIKVN